MIDVTTYWAPLLHAYQPPTQDFKVLKNIDKECYKPMFSLLEKYDDIQFTLNIQTKRNCVSRLVLKMGDTE